MADVFISYAKAEKPTAQQVAQALVAQGYSVWWDDELLCHKAYPDLIQEQLDQAGAVLVLWSATSIRSEWVRSEADAGRNMRKLVQASIDGRVPPMPFNQFQSASLDGWRGEPDHPGWRKVSRSLVDLFAGVAATPASGSGARPPVRQEKGGSWRVPLFLFFGTVVAALTIAGASGYLFERSANVVQNEVEPLRFGRAAVLINRDSDAQVHQERDAASPVVGRLNGGEAFTTYLQAGDWWEVRTAEGLTGFVPRRLFRLVDEAEPAEENVGNSAEADTNVADLNTATDTMSTNTTTDAFVPSPAPIAAARAAPSGTIFFITSQRQFMRQDLRCHSLADLRSARQRIYSVPVQADRPPTDVESYNISFLDDAIRDMERRGEGAWCW
jgi:hypothetical protein